MANTAYPGLNLGTAPIPFWASSNEFLLCTPGNLFATAISSEGLGMRQKCQVKITPITVNEEGGRVSLDKHLVEAEIVGLQTSFAVVKDMYLLSKGFVQARFKTAKGKFLNFTNNTGTQASPAGTQVLGVSFSFKFTETERTITIKLKGTITDTEAEYLFNNMSSGATGGTGGATDALTTITYARTGYIRSGTVSISCDGANIGVKKGTTFEMKSYSSIEDDNLRPMNSMVEIDCQTTVLQDGTNDMLASYTTAPRLDKDWVINTKNDETITLSAGAVSVMPSFTHGDGEYGIMLKMQGRSCYNLTEGTPENIDIGVTAPTDLKIIRYGF